MFLGDCVELLGQFASESVDLVFADPPFNIGYEYDVYVDRKERDEYLAWSKSWIKQVYRVLSATGTFWLAIGDDYAAELKLIAQECGFIPRSWVIWYYTFGVNCVRKFTRSHTHLLYFVKHPSNSHFAPMIQKFEFLPPGNLFTTMPVQIPRAVARRYLDFASARCGNFVHRSGRYVVLSAGRGYV